jgi:hypothetical protein
MREIEDDSNAMPIFIPWSRISHTFSSRRESHRKIVVVPVRSRSYKDFNVPVRKEVTSSAPLRRQAGGPE